MKVKILIEGDYLPQKGSHYQESITQRFEDGVCYLNRVLRSAFYELKNQRITIIKGE